MEGSTVGGKPIVQTEKGGEDPFPALRWAAESARRAVSWCSPELTARSSLCCLTLQVIAVVMDVFTDIDIFRDLQEISRKQGVAVYILLDQALLSQFLDMCMDLRVHPEQEKVCVTRFQSPHDQQE